MTVQAKPVGGAWRAKFSTAMYQNEVYIETVTRLLAKTDVRVQAESTGNNRNVSAALFGYLVHDDLALS